MEYYERLDRESSYLDKSRELLRDAISGGSSPAVAVEKLRAAARLNRAWELDPVLYGLILPTLVLFMGFPWLPVGTPGPLQALLFGLVAFMPPIYAYAGETTSRPGESAFLGGLFLFVTLLATGLLVSILAGGATTVGLLIYHVATKLAPAGVPSKVLAGFAAVPGLFLFILAFAYFLSPSRRFTAPWDVRQILLDAWIALRHGPCRVVFPLAGGIVLLSMFWVGHFDFLAQPTLETAGLGTLAGLLVGLSFVRRERSFALGYEIRVQLARALLRLHRRAEARYWVGELKVLPDWGVPETTLQAARSLEAEAA